MQLIKNLEKVERDMRRNLGKIFKQVLGSDFMISTKDMGDLSEFSLVDIGEPVVDNFGYVGIYVGHGEIKVGSSACGCAHLLNRPIVIHPSTFMDHITKTDPRNLWTQHLITPTYSECTLLTPDSENYDNCRGLLDCLGLTA
jgi:hypothetical protein